MMTVGMLGDYMDFGIDSVVTEPSPSLAAYVCEPVSPTCSLILEDYVNEVAIEEVLEEFRVEKFIDATILPGIINE